MAIFCVLLKELKELLGSTWVSAFNMCNWQTLIKDGPQRRLRGEEGGTSTPWKIGGTSPSLENRFLSLDKKSKSCFNIFNLPPLKLPMVMT